ncbi:Glutaredoxin family protein [Rhynchospora pubera]|uniref:Glutaredoxin family protein n=1 Tax=Rhynchospora pubera TaxID=906938 RepID=A0AAV8DLQ9_9POAL|nr:Glutaredoxin family protein [Rhynchospora pubera]
MQMQGVRCLPLPSNPDRDLLTIPTNSNPVPTRQRRPRALTIDAGEETPESRIGRLIREHPVVIFARPGCCMCHVMKQLLAAVGSHPSVIEVEEGEIRVFESTGMPALFVGGTPVGGIEGLMGLHLSGRLVPRLRELGVM